MTQNFHHLSLSRMFLHIGRENKVTYDLLVEIWAQFPRDMFYNWHCVPGEQAVSSLGGKCKILAHFTISCLFDKLK